MKKKEPAESKLGMRIKEIMTREVVTIAPTASVREAAQRMAERDVGMLPVCDGERIAGLLTDRDITTRAVGEGRDPGTTRVSDIMTTEVFFCFDYEDVQDAVLSFEEKQIRRLLILNRKKQLVGVLSIGDIAVDTGNKKLAGEVLQKVSQPER